MVFKMYFLMKNIILNLRLSLIRHSSWKTSTTMPTNTHAAPYSTPTAALSPIRYSPITQFNSVSTPQCAIKIQQTDQTISVNMKSYRNSIVTLKNSLAFSLMRKSSFRVHLGCISTLCIGLGRIMGGLLLPFSQWFRESII